MKQIFKILMLFIFLVILLGVILFFWASSSNLSEKEYTKLTSNNLDQKIENDSIYSIVTYNIGHLEGLYNDTSLKTKSFFENNFEAASKLFNSINADIIAFQDIDFNSKRSYKINQSSEFAKLGYNYIADAIYHDKTYIPSPYWPISRQTGKVISGQSILSKFLITGQERIVLKNDLQLPFYKKRFRQDRIAQIVKLVIGNETIIIINVHLEDISISSRAIQFDYVYNLFKKYSEDYPTILLGDFNSSINKEDAVVKPLFETSNIGYSKYKNLDYIFFTKNSIEIENSRVLYEFDKIANHLPVLMEFKLK